MGMVERGKESRLCPLHWVTVGGTQTSLSCQNAHEHPPITKVVPNQSGCEEGALLISFKENNNFLSNKSHIILQRK